MKKAVINIPNETKLNIDPFIRDVSDGGFHVPIIVDFCNKYHLGITYKSLGIEEGEVNGNYFQLALASLGHVVITPGEMLPVYLPSAITLLQYEWLKQNQLFFTKNKTLLAYGIINENGDTLKSNSYF